MRKKVIVVDDDQRMLESLQSLLDAAGYAVSTYTSAETLLAQNALLEADCLITDVKMPRIDGLKLLQIAKSQRPELPVILVTGADIALADLQELSAKSGDRLFTKPIDGKKLLSAVHAALRDSTAA